MGVMKEIATRMATDPNLAGKDPGNRPRTSTPARPAQNQKHPDHRKRNRKHRHRGDGGNGKWLRRLMRSKIGGPCELCNSAAATRTVWKRSLRHGGTRRADNLMGVCGVCEMDWKFRQGG